MKETNLFNWATSELSQDAFICWLLSFAKNQRDNPQLSACAWDFIRRIPNLKNAKQLVRIDRQVVVEFPERRNGRIDVLLTVDDYTVIIEDKIFSPADDEQLENYIEALGAKKSIGVFYKPVSQCRFSKKFFTFTRDELFPIFKPYKDKIDNDIFTDYLEYLQHFDDEENAYKSLPISQWYGIRYNGFFEHLKDCGLVPKDAGYGYVANPQGGFMAMWWDSKTPQQVKTFNFDDNHFNHLYIQIEDDRICLKMSLEQRNFGAEDVRHAWETVRRYFRDKIGDTFNFVRFSFGNGKSHARWMTVGYVLYDEKNYRQKVQLMCQLFDAL